MRTSGGTDGGGGLSAEGVKGEKPATAQFVDGEAALIFVAAEEGEGAVSRPAV